MNKPEGDEHTFPFIYTTKSFPCRMAHLKYSSVTLNASISTAATTNSAKLRASPHVVRCHVRLDIHRSGPLIVTFVARSDICCYPKLLDSSRPEYCCLNHRHKNERHQQDPVTDLARPLPNLLTVEDNPPVGMR
jgi:hypothetical protein